MVELAGDLASTDELDHEGEQVKHDEDGCNPAREDPKGSEVKLVGWAGEPDYAAECSVAGCCEETWSKQDHEEGDQER